MPLLLSKMLKYFCLVPTAGNIGVDRFWTSDAEGLDHCPKGGKYLAHFTCWLWAKFVNSDGCSFLQMHGFEHYEGQHGRLQWWTSEKMLTNQKRSGTTVGTVIHLNWESSLSAPTICNMSRTSLGGCRYAKSTGTALRLSWSSVAGVVKTVRTVYCLSNSTRFFLLLTLLCLPWVVPYLVQTASTPRSSCLCKSSGHRCKKEAATGSTDANKMLSELWDDKCSCVWDSVKGAVQNLMRSTRDWRHTHNRLSNWRLPMTSVTSRHKKQVAKQTQFERNCSTRVSIKRSMFFPRSFQRRCLWKWDQSTKPLTQGNKNNSEMRMSVSQNHQIRWTCVNNGASSMQWRQQAQVNFDVDVTCPTRLGRASGRYHLVSVLGVVLTNMGK